MTTAEEQRHLSLRLKKAAVIYQNPEQFKVCDQCLSIAVKSAGFCPLCHAYRWQEDKLDVQATAITTGKFAFPFTAGTVPRI